MAIWAAYHSRQAPKEEPRPRRATVMHALEVLRLLTATLFLVICVPAVMDGRNTPWPIWFILAALFVFSFPSAWLALLRPALPLPWAARLYRLTLPLSVRADAMGLGWWAPLRHRLPRVKDLDALEQQLQARASPPVSGVGIALWGLLLLGRGDEATGLSVLRFGARICDLPTGAAGRRCCRLLLQCRAASLGRWEEVLDWAYMPAAGRGLLHHDHRRLGALARSELQRAPLDPWDRWQLWWMKPGWARWPRSSPAPAPPPAPLEGSPLLRALTLSRDAARRPALPEHALALAQAWADALEDPELRQRVERRAQALGPRASVALASSSVEARARSALRPLLRSVGPLTAPGRAGELLEAARLEEVDELGQQLRHHLAELRTLTPRQLPRYAVLGPVARLLEDLARLRRLSSPIELRLSATPAIAPLISLSASLHNHCQDQPLAHWIMQETLELSLAVGHESHTELLRSNLKALG